MHNKEVFIIADSRGRLLKEQLDETFNEITYSLYWKKGLRLTETAELVTPIILNIRPKIIILLNGICDVTYLRTCDPWAVAMRVPDTNLTVYNYMVAVDQVHSDRAFFHKS